MSLISEIKKRNVVRAAVTYAVVSWLLIQVADVLLDAFDAPGWLFRGFIILLVTGFPVALIMAWFFELTTSGLVRNEDLPENYASEDQFRRYLNPVIIAMLSAAVILFALDKFVWTDEGGFDGSGTRFQNTARAGAIAVLPFVNRSKQADDVYFADGIHDDLLTMLARIDSFKVISRTSVMRYRDTKKSIPEIGRELDAAYLLEGAVQRAGDTVRVNAQLIDSDSDSHLWAETFDRQLSTTNLFSIQSEIARAIAAALDAKLSQTDESRLQKVPTDSLAAYDAYFKGRQSLLKRNVAAYEEALSYFETAVSLDSGFAGAYAGLCDTHLSLYVKNSAVGHFIAAEAACQKALSIDSGQAEVRVALAALLRHHGDYQRAETELRQALDLAPNNVEALNELGYIMALQGMIRESERLLLESVSFQPDYWPTYDSLFMFYRQFDDRPDRYERAVKYAMKSVELMPENASAWNNLGTAYHSLQQYDAAKVAWDRALELEPTRTGYTNRGLQYYYEGFYSESAEMQLMAIELAPDDHRAWGRLAESYRLMGGEEESAAQAYGTAIRLAESMIGINSLDWRTRGLLATYYAHNDQPGDAKAMIESALAMAQRDPEALLYSALVWHELGNDEFALNALEEMVDRDETYVLYVSDDPDLADLRGTHRFEQIMKRLEKDP